MPSPKELLRRYVAGSVHAALVSRALPMTFTPAPTLVVAPHADDETLGCGALLARRAAAGLPCKVLFITDSGAAGWTDRAERRDRASLRRHEALSALAQLGLPATVATFLDAPDGELANLPASTYASLSAIVAEHITRTGAQDVFAPCEEDGSSEHGMVTRLVAAALAMLPTSPHLWHYPVWAWWNAARMLPWLKDTSSLRSVPARSWRRRKLAALAQHRSQLGHLPPVLLAAADFPAEIFRRVPAPISSP